MVQRLGHGDGVSKKTGSIKDVDTEKDGTCKMDGQNKNAVVLERVEEGRIMLELIKMRKRNWLGHWLMYALEQMVNGKRVRGRR